MKNRPWVILLGLLLCLFIAPCPAKADAFETLPAEVQQLFLSEYSQEDVADTLTFSLANGQTCCMILNHFGWLYGYFTQGDGYVLNYCNSNLANVGTATTLYSEDKLSTRYSLISASSSARRRTFFPARSVSSCTAPVAA